jgi:hypothetical protein
MGLFGWIIRTAVFYAKFTIFLGALLLILVCGTIHAAIYGGPVMSDDMWFIYKILLLLLAPVVVAFIVAGSEKRSWGVFTAVFFAGCAASALLACTMSWGTYTHAPSFREAKLYSVVDGKLVIPEENRGLLERNCGHITNEGLKGTCKVLVYCQDYDAAAYERMGCDGLLRKSTSPALLDLAMQERRGYEYDNR